MAGFTPRTVYPRVCGGSLHPRRLRKADVGLSPRVRGKLLVVYVLAYLGRSIPACAGEALPPLRLHPLPAVYPRVCGGSFVDDAD